MFSVNTKIAEESVSHLADLIAYTNGEIKALIDILSKAHVKVLEDIAKLEAKNITNARLDNTEKAIREAYKEASFVYEEKLYGSGNKLVQLESSVAIDQIKNELPIKLDFVKPSQSLLKRIVKDKTIRISKDKGIKAPKFLEDFFGINTDNVVNQMRDGLASGRTPAQIVKDLKGTAKTGYTDGILWNTFSKSTESFVRTATLSWANDAREKTYEANADILKGQSVNATLDTRTCMICAGYDGKAVLWNKEGEVYKDELNGSRPPFHYNCRCTLVPILRSWKDLGIDPESVPVGVRSSMDGNLPSDTTYSEWLSKQSKKRQKEILGEARYKLYLQGEPINKFANNGRILSLNELEARRKSK